MTQDNTDRIMRAFHLGARRHADLIRWNVPCTTCCCSGEEIRQALNETLDLISLGEITTISGFLRELDTKLSEIIMFNLEHPA